MGSKRFDIFLEKHIGLGIRWNTDCYSLHLSFAILCITITIGFGKDKIKEVKHVQV